MSGLKKEVRAFNSARNDLTDAVFDVMTRHESVFARFVDKLASMPGHKPVKLGERRADKTVHASCELAGLLMHIACEPNYELLIDRLFAANTRQMSFDLSEFLLETTKLIEQVVRSQQILHDSSLHSTSGPECQTSKTSVEETADGRASADASSGSVEELVGLAPAGRSLGKEGRRHV